MALEPKGKLRTCTIQNLKSCQLDDLPTFVRDDSGHTGVSGFIVTNPEITSSNKNEPQHFSRIRDSYDSTYSD